jgi:nucleoside-diphosphate-sugar epimerase
MSQKSALIGHTGFVGGNLDRQAEFQDRYDSGNIAEIEGKRYGLVVCAGIQSVKWWANRNPDDDWRGIKSLLDRLEKMEAERFVLISTVDVYPTPIGVTEEDNPHGLDNHAYGRHRLAVEDFVRERFGQRALIARLPALFGPGLKKNVVYDLIHDNQLEKINPAGSFQWYDLNDLWPDIVIAQEHRINLINFAVAPVTTADIVTRYFPEKAADIGSQAGPAGSYDFRSMHAEIWSGRDGYLRSREEVLEKLGRFAAEEMNRL